MMPTCSYGKCHKVAKCLVALTYDEDCKMYKQPIYVCEKHAKKLHKKLGLEWENV